MTYPSEIWIHKWECGAHGCGKNHDTRSAAERCIAKHALNTVRDELGPSVFCRALDVVPPRVVAREFDISAVEAVSILTRFSWTLRKYIKDEDLINNGCRGIIKTPKAFNHVWGKPCAVWKLALARYYTLRRS